MFKRNDVEIYTGDYNHLVWVKTELHNQWISAQVRNKSIGIFGVQPVLLVDKKDEARAREIVEKFRLTSIRKLDIREIGSEKSQAEEVEIS